AHEGQAAEVGGIRREGPLELLAHGDRRLREVVGAAAIELGGEPDEEVDAGGAREALAKKDTDGRAGHAPDDFANQEALRIHVIAMARARLPPRRLSGERARDD